MQYGISFLSVVPLRAEPSDSSEQTSQILYGAHFKVLEHRKKWSRIRLGTDKYEGWIDNKQFKLCTKEDYDLLHNKAPKLVANLVDFISTHKKELLPICIGANLNALDLLQHKFDGEYCGRKNPKSKFIQTALLYLNTPYQWGGKTPFGIDCSGFTQMVYLLNGHVLKRDASQQAKQGEALSFIEESEAGDLAFFDNHEGKITHVGIIMDDNYIIHASGMVRVDRLDHTGIFNAEQRKHTHKLRVIKRIVT